MDIYYRKMFETQSNDNSVFQILPGVMKAGRCTQCMTGFLDLDFSGIKPTAFVVCLDIKYFVAV